MFWVGFEFEMSNLKTIIVISLILFVLKMAWKTPTFLHAQNIKQQNFYF